MPDNVRVASNSTGVFGENPPDNSTLINQEIQPLPSCTGTRRPRTRNGNRGQLLHTKGVWTHPAASSRHTSVDGSTSGVDPVKVSSGLLYCFQCANALDGCPSRGKSTVNPHILSSLRGGCAEDFFFFVVVITSTFQLNSYDTWYYRRFYPHLQRSSGQAVVRGVVPASPPVRAFICYGA